jgi:hypothetical protein
MIAAGCRFSVKHGFHCKDSRFPGGEHLPYPASRSGGDRRRVECYAIEQNLRNQSPVSLSSSKLHQSPCSMKKHNFEISGGTDAKARSYDRTAIRLCKRKSLVL